MASAGPVTAEQNSRATEQRVLGLVSPPKQPAAGWCGIPQTATNTMNVSAQQQLQQQLGCVVCLSRRCCFQHHDTRLSPSPSVLCRCSLLQGLCAVPDLQGGAAGGWRHRGCVEGACVLVVCLFCVDTAHAGPPKIGPHQNSKCLRPALCYCWQHSNSRSGSADNKSNTRRQWRVPGCARPQQLRECAGSMLPSPVPRLPPHTQLWTDICSPAPINACFPAPINADTLPQLCVPVS